MPLDATGDEVDPGPFESAGDGFGQADLDASMVGWETMAVAFGWVVEY